jgi:hypothetical protein
MNRTVRNEALKLAANWMNAASVTVIGAGGLLPMLSIYFGIGTPVREQGGAWLLFIVCAFVAAGLHFLGQFFLRRLIDGSSRDSSFSSGNGRCCRSGRLDQLSARTQTLS